MYIFIRNNVYTWQRVKHLKKTEVQVYILHVFNSGEFNFCTQWTSSIATHELTHLAEKRKQKRKKKKRERNRRVDRKGCTRQVQNQRSKRKFVEKRKVDDFWTKYAFTRLADTSPEQTSKHSRRGERRYREEDERLSIIVVKNKKERKWKQNYERKRKKKNCIWNEFTCALMVHDRTKTFNRYTRTLVERWQRDIYICARIHASNIISIHIYIYIYICAFLIGR